MENRLKRKLADCALTFCLGVNRSRTPNISMIAAVPGIDGLHIGSNDPCSEMGIPGKYRDPRYLQAVEKAGRGGGGGRHAGGGGGGGGDPPQPSAACCSTTNCRPSWCGSARAT